MLIERVGNDFFQFQNRKNPSPTRLIRVIRPSIRPSLKIKIQSKISTKMKNPVLLLLFLAIAACKPSEKIRVLKSAEITLPPHMTAIAVVDRTKPAKGWINVLEGILTGEQIGQDREARRVAVSEVIAQLAESPRVTIKNSGIELPSSKGGASMPPPLEWSQIEGFCVQTGSSGVLVVENFDSDNTVRTTKREVKTKDEKGNEVKTNEFDAQLDMNVRIGWRLYDPKQRIVVDIFTTSKNVSRNTTGAKTEADATRNLPNQIQLARDLARSGGEEYGRRIAPSYVELERTYYHKAKGFDDQMQQAKRYAESGQWQKAADIWQKIVEKSADNRDAAGKAAFNLAVFHEVQGNLDEARKWAQKSYADFGNKKAKSYNNELRERQDDARKTESQMNNKKV